MIEISSGRLSYANENTKILNLIHLAMLDNKSPKVSKHCSKILEMLEKPKFEQ